MLFIAGLGNPGPCYENSRHNIGFMMVDIIHDCHQFSSWSRKFQALLADGVINGEKILLIKPQTYMNCSGQAVGKVMRFYRRLPNDLVIIHDDLDLPQGKARLKTGGSSGGHNGIKSIDLHCSMNYRRLRLGIGHPGHKSLVNEHVMGNFSKSDEIWLEPFLTTINNNIGLLVKGDNNNFINQVMR
ncbi:MAG: PTH1 family [Candidatus Tokpelaia sp. JSC188]|nr:MAG: PTH1 family [Candidatus Tokpelaia sp. JSC188]